THGNELCGAIAVDFLFRSGLRPARGKLSLGFANVAAYRRFDRANPVASRFVDEDFNRVWAADVLDGPRQSVELARAREIRPLIDQVDLMLDIHSMQQKTVPLMLSGPLAKGRDFARRLGYPATVVADRGHSAGTRMRDYGGFGVEKSAKNALLVECGQHWEQASETVALRTMLLFLRESGVIDAAAIAPSLGAEPLAPQKVVEVTDAITVKTEAFAFSQDFIGMECIAEAGTVIARDGAADVVTPYANCVLIMPSRRLKPGQTAVRLGRYLS
ncbi:MAG: succinylglutamate desuccinylase, partial [Alphaproteobacteria bacterium]|nr:succinylglutamate desuccinylase [Alphaproteobacteria bacterium]